MQGYRKFAVAMTALILAFVLALKMRLTAEYATIAAVCVGAFTAASAFVKGKTGQGE